MRRLLTVMFPLGLAAALHAQQQDQAALPIRVDVNVVTVRFTVKGGAGHLINSLEQDDFRVSENGVPREIVFFEAPRNRSGAASPLRLAFLLDISGSTYATRAEEIAAAQTFLENVHNFTEVGIFGFTDSLVTFQEFTSDRKMAQEAFSKTRRHLGRTAIYDSLDQLLIRLGRRPAAGQNVVILISDGIDDDYRKSAAAASRARQAGISIYTVLVPSAAQLYIRPAPGADRETERRERERLLRQQAFAELSASTSGQHFSGFEAILDFEQVMAQINDGIFGNLYSVGYRTDDPSRTRRERDIHLEVRRPDAFISVPFRSIPQRLAAKKEFIAALFDNDAISSLPDPSEDGLREIGADLDLLPARREGGQVGLPFRIKINPYTVQSTRGGDVRTQLGVIGLLLDPAGNEVVRLREIFRVNLDAKRLREGRGIIYTNKLLAPPGRYALKLAVVELNTWKMTSFAFDQVQIVDR